MFWCIDIQRGGVRMTSIMKQKQSFPLLLTLQTWTERQISRPKRDWPSQEEKGKKDLTGWQIKKKKHLKT